jgi:hypothetical protein
MQLVNQALLINNWQMVESMVGISLILSQWLQDFALLVQT